MSSSRTPIQSNEIAHGEDKSPPTEEEIAELVEEFDISYERAKAILQENRFLGRGRSMVAVSREEFDELMEELARSGENMFLFGKKTPPEEQQEEDN